MVEWVGVANVLKEEEGDGGVDGDEEGLPNVRFGLWQKKKKTLIYLGPLWQLTCKMNPK